MLRSACVGAQSSLASPPICCSVNSIPTQVLCSRRPRFMAQGLTGWSVNRHPKAHVLCSRPDSWRFLCRYSIVISMRSPRDGPEPGAGTIESAPHNSVHEYHASILYALGRHPIFYLHHANIDKLWEIWRGLRREDIDDLNYLDSDFVFYEKNAQLIKLNLSIFSNGSLTNISFEGVSVCALGERILETCSFLVSRNLSFANCGQKTLVF
ncbi:hypothetical protein L7F22_020056 [Adiantum nelumboides]|nr:hypothetical protein [Adiantum nelumboides]